MRRPMSTSAHLLHRIFPSDQSRVPGDMWRFKKDVYEKGMGESGSTSCVFQLRFPGKPPIISCILRAHGSRRQSRIREVSHLRATLHGGTNSRKTTIVDPDERYDTHRLECFRPLSQRCMAKTPTLFNIFDFVVQDHVLVLNLVLGIGSHFRDIVGFPFQVDKKPRANIVRTTVIPGEFFQVKFWLVE